LKPIETAVMNLKSVSELQESFAQNLKSIWSC